MHGARRPKAAHCHLHVIALCYYRSTFYSDSCCLQGCCSWRAGAAAHRRSYSCRNNSSVVTSGKAIVALQRDSAEKFAGAGPNDLHAEAKQDKGSEPDENVRTYGSKQSRNSI